MSGRDLSDKAEREQAEAELEALLFAANRPLAPAFLAKRIYIEESQAVELLHRGEPGGRAASSARSRARKAVARAAAAGGSREVAARNQARA